MLQNVRKQGINSAMILQKVRKQRTDKILAQVNTKDSGKR